MLSARNTAEATTTLLNGMRSQMGIDSQKPVDICICESSVRIALPASSAPHLFSKTGY